MKWHLNFTIFIFCFLAAISCNLGNKPHTAVNAIGIEDSVNYYNYKVIKLLNENSYYDLVGNIDLYMLLAIEFPYGDSSMILSVKLIDSIPYMNIYKFSPLSNYLFRDFDGDQISANLSTLRINKNDYDSLLNEVNYLIENKEKLRTSSVLEKDIHGGNYTGLLFSKDNKIYRHNTWSLKNDILHDLVKQMLIIGKQDDYTAILLKS